MKENTKTWLIAGGVTALLAFTALLYSLYPGIAQQAGIDSSDLGGGALAAMILWLVLRRQKPMAQRTRLVFAVAVGAGLLLGLTVFFMS